MPELPEVEVTRLSFVREIRGAQVLAAKAGKPLRWPLGVAPAALQGRQVVDVRRRGKYLLIDLDQGLLLWHLGMSGSLVFRPDPGPPGPHDHFDLQTTQGTLRLNDPRRFGAVVYAASEQDAVAHKLLGHLGVEPLGDAFEAAAFHHALRQRSAAIKQVLLAGDIVVGVGNIYASEVLFLAGIRPSTRAHRISRARADQLHQAIRTVLARAVAVGGSTLRDFSNAHGEAGHFQQEAMVYGRAGEGCHRCGATIKALRQGQRSSFYCPACQKP